MMEGIFVVPTPGFERLSAALFQTGGRAADDCLLEYLPAAMVAANPDDVSPNSAD